MNAKRGTILAVDDKPDNLFVLTRLISEYLPDCTVFPAKNAEEGLAIAAKTPLACALIDVQMPGTDGIEMCRILKGKSFTAGVPVILMTAHRTGPEMRVRGLEAGADDFIAKPVDNIELVARIKVALRTRQAEDKLREMNAHLEELVRQRTEALRESESSLRTVADGLPMLIAHVDSDQRIRFANRAYAQWFGLTPAELIGRRTKQLLGEILYSQVEAKIDAVMTGKPVMFGGASIQANGETRYTQTQYVPHLDESGRTAGYFVITQDVTERRKQERALHRLATAVEQSGESFLLIDVQRIIHYANPAFEKLSGYPRAEVKDVDILSLQGLGLDAIFHQAIWASVSSGHTWSGRIDGTTKDGRSFVADATISPVANTEGNISSYAIVMRDVSRMAELERQVRQMQKMEAIGTLAGGIAHDFNNILSPIIGYTEMILDSTPQGSPLECDLQQVLTAAHRAKELVKHILTFSRQAEQQKRPVQVSLILKEALKLLRASMPSTIAIKRHIARNAETATAFGDASQIHQILMNLCTNAKHAMRGKSGELTVELTIIQLGHESATGLQDLQPGPHLRLSVKDSGEGISAAVKDRIFDPYFTTKPPEEGTGMGLAVVYGIVRNHGGAITVESEPGKGSVFHIFLPCAEVVDKVESRTEGDLPRGSERILLVDDEVMLADMSQRRLNSLGYKVTAVTDPREAIRTFLANPKDFDLVITDYTMPHATGVELAREAMNIRSDVPIILCTGFSEDITRERALELGFREFLLKPIDNRSLALAVRKVMETQAADVGTC